ncbi:MAG: PQQ-binding-like beta-propeller repeat protein [Planctomycetota bacterium]
MPKETRGSGKPAFAALAVVALSLCVVLLAGGNGVCQQNETALARDILSSAEVKGGLIIHIGCGDGKLTAALRLNERYLVHGLDANPANVEQARRHIRSLGAYGNVSVDTFDGKHLPYIDNFVNLVVASGEWGVESKEIMRVLAPNGVALLLNPKSQIQNPKLQKPWPKEIDEWTHYLHDASNNAVAHDTVIGPPRRYQWHGSPRWARHHDHMASMSALISARGRIFYIFDEGPTASIILPSKWFLTARDAFNGTILWKRPIEKWHTQLWPLKSGPADLPRRLVAVEDRVYVTLGFDAPVSVLDAATGDIIRTLDGTAGAEEIIVSEGIVFLVVGRPDARDTLSSVADIRKRQMEENCDGADRAVVAVQASNGQMLWRKQGQVVPLTLAADGQRVFFYDNDKMICLDTRTGKQLWASDSLPRSAKFTSDYAPTLVVYNDVVFFCGGENMVPHHGAQDFMQALSVETGKTLWTVEHPPSGYQSPEDILVASGLVWTGATTQGEDSGEFIGRDLQTGEVRKQYVPAERQGWGHHRCHRSKATDRYILTGRSGIEFLDVDTTDWVGYRWVRGACLYGIMPANGLIYAPPHDCACFIEGKLSAFSAVAPESPTWKPPKEVGDGGRIQQGPAYSDEIQNLKSKIQNENDWPTYRHDTRRSGHAKTSVPYDAAQVWQADLGGRLSSPVLADGKLFVAAIDAHTIHALAADSGKEAWAYTAGGRVDSPPTIWEGRVLFGSADGWVYCLRADDGRLIWRFRAAPEDRRMMGFEQVESLWPVSGSVLVVPQPPGGSAVVYCVAGRSSYLDGGMRLLRLDAKTGQKLSETLLDETGQEGKGLDVAAPDILSSDGKHVYMKSLRFSMDGVCEGSATKDVTKQVGEDAHLFSPTSLLDGAWFHRSYWIYGRMYASSATGYYLAGLMTPGGRILTFDDDTVYGYGRKAQYYRWTTPLEYTLFAAEKERGDFEMPERKGRTSSIQVAASESLNPGSVPTTIEAWVNSETGNGVVLARGGGKIDGIVLLFNTGKPQFIVRTGEQIATAACGKHLVNQWVHLAAVLTADGKAELYVNGRLAGEARAPRLPTLGPKTGIDIGLDTGGAVGDYRPSFGFKGMIDEVRVYNGPLTAGEIQQHAANPGETAAAGATLVLRYSFDKDKANPKGEGKVADESGRGNDGVTEGLRLDEGKAGRCGKFIGAKPGILQLPFAVKHRWAKEVPITVRAMALADKTLFVAGPPDLLDEEEAAKQLTDPKIQTAFVEQAAALDGKKGALLWAVSASDGARLAEQKLTAMPVFDSMIAAQGRLYLSTTGGQVICLGAQ